MNRWLPSAVLVAALLVVGGCSDEDPPASPEIIQPEIIQNVIFASEYLNNQFFRLDLPPYINEEGIFIYDFPDGPGRDPNHEFIWSSSIQIYRFVQNQQPQNGDVDNVACYIDSTGRWSEFNGLPSLPGFTWESSFAILGLRWRPVEFDLLLDPAGSVVAIDLLHQMDYYGVLVVVYTVVGDLNDPVNTILYQVGDRPGEDEANRVYIEGVPHLRMKILKTQIPTHFTFQYVLRNLYSLGGSNIDAESFDLRIEITDLADDRPHLDHHSGLDWFRIFGLDRSDPQGSGSPDNQIDKHDHFIFDFQRGLLKFPFDMPQPFNADEATYTANADTSSFDFNESRLAVDRIPEIYDWTILPSHYSRYNRWRIVTTCEAD